MSLPKQWVSEWLYLQEHLADDEGRAERDFQFIMTHSGTKHDIPGQGLCYRQLVTRTNLWSITGVFLTTLVEKKALSVQEVNSLIQGKMKKWGVVHAVHWKEWPCSCILWYLQKIELGIPNDGNKGVREIQEPVWYK